MVKKITCGSAPAAINSFVVDEQGNLQTYRSVVTVFDVLKSSLFGKDLVCVEVINGGVLVDR